VRAGPLSDNNTIDLLNNKFVNVWILEKDIRTIQATMAAGDSRHLADAVIPVLKKGSPVDSLIFTTELKFIAIQSANDVVADTVAMRVRSYQKFLDDALVMISSAAKTDH
jgi:hypothetical protein